MGEKRFSNVQGVVDYVRQAGCIQYDPVDACGRNADLTLQSRVNDYRKKMLYEALYEKRALVDYWDKNMAIFPVEDWPLFTRKRKGFQQADLRSEKEIQTLGDKVRAFLKARGPSFSGDLDMKEKVDWYWSETSAARAVLEALYFRGELGIHHKRGTQRCYDFMENLLPETLLKTPDPNLKDEDYYAMRLKRRIGAVGLLWNKPSDAFLGIENFKGDARNAAFEALIQAKEIKSVCIEGFKAPVYYLSEDESLFEKNAPMEERTEFIAPLDPMMWDRKLIKALFDFDYKWEIYTPEVQRKFGYYVLPILQGDKMVGRIEMHTQVKKSQLTVRNIWYEKGVKADKWAIKARIKQFAEFSETKEIIYDK
jgi:Uncharacterized protein conserved in bacteria